MPQRNFNEGFSYHVKDVPVKPPGKVNAAMNAAGGMGRTSDFLPATLLLYQVLLDDSLVDSPARIITDGKAYNIAIDALRSALQVCFLLKKESLPWWMVDPTEEAVAEAGLSAEDAAIKTLGRRVDGSVGIRQGDQLVGCMNDRRPWHLSLLPTCSHIRTPHFPSNRMVDKLLTLQSHVLELSGELVRRRAKGGGAVGGGGAPEDRPDSAATEDGLFGGIKVCALYV